MFIRLLNSLLYYLFYIYCPIINYYIFLNMEIDPSPQQQIVKQLLYREQLLLRNIPCQRRYKVKAFLTNQLLTDQIMWITNYRLLFHGQVRPQFPMQIILSDITTVKMTINKTNTIYILLLKRKLPEFDNQTKQYKNQDLYFGFDKKYEQNAKKVKQMIQSLIQIPSSISEQQLKYRLLLSDKVRYQIYNNLVVTKKLVKQQDFWAKDQLLKEYIGQKRIQFQKHLNEKKKNIVDIKLKYEHEQSSSILQNEEIQGYSLKREIESIKKNISDKINDSSVIQFRKQIEQMYLKDSEHYKKYFEEQQNFSNEGIKFQKKEVKMQIQIPQENKYFVIEPIQIPQKQIKFEVNPQQVKKQFIHHQTSRRLKKTEMNSVIKQITQKTIQYVRLFYQLMRQNSQTLKQMEKQIRQLHRTIKQHQKHRELRQLDQFITRSLNNYMRFRKNQLCFV